MDTLSLVTTKDYYMAFLDGIRREYTSVVPPVIFNRIINEAEFEWVQAKLDSRELSQKRIDDINFLRVATDDLFEKDGVKMNAILPIDGYPNHFYLPYETNHQVDSLGMVLIGENHYPVYLSGCRVDFQLSSSPDKWTEAKILRNDVKGHYLESVFRRPSATKIYYEQAGDYIIAYVAKGDQALKMNLEYYTYPRRVFFDKLNPEDNAGFPVVTDGKSPYQDGYGSVNSVLKESQKREVLDIAVRIFLERRSSERYKTMLNETIIKQSKQ